MDTIIIALCVLNLAGLAAILVLVVKLGGKGAENAALAEMSRQLRDEIAAGNSHVSDKIADMTRENYQSRIELAESINKSLVDIRDKNADHSDRQARILREIAEKNAESGERQTRALEAAITKMQESNEKKLEEMRATVDEKLTQTLGTRLDSSFKTVSEQLENVYKSLGEMKELSTGVTSNVTALNRVLTNVKSRGTWAEIQLEGILDQTIPGMYEKNYSPTGRGERVEFAVRIPSGSDGKEIVYLPIDSKFPREDYERLCDAADRANPEDAAAARKALEARVKSEARDIRDKYIKVPQTTPFGILYLATEGLYAEIASSKTGLPEVLHNEFGVMVAGPSTITALLNSLAMGFRTVALNEKANDVMKLLGAAKAQYEKFGTVLEKAKSQIESAGKTLGDAQDRNRIIQSKLRGVESLDASDADNLLGTDTREQE